MTLPINALTFLSLILLSGCGGSSNSAPEQPPQTQSRSFFMGFTPWMYEASLDAQTVTYDRLAQHGDIIKHHIMGGIPWQEALDQTAYHSNVENEINGRLANTPTSMAVFLAIDSLNTARNGLSPYWGESDNLPLPTEWATRTWSSNEVITAYVNFSSDLIDRFQPEYFEYGTEASELLLNDANGFADYQVFAQAVYSQLKARYPNLKLMTSVAIKSPGSSEMSTINSQYVSMMDYTDVLGISVYPYVFFNHSDRGDPNNLTADWLNQINTLRNGKPWAISETGWIGENLSISDFQYSENSDPVKQSAYISKLLTEAESMNAEMVIWWCVTDFDTLWNNELGQDPIAKIWKDIGLYDESQLPRTGLTIWDEWLAFSRQ